MGPSEASWNPLPWFQHGICHIGTSSNLAQSSCKVQTIHITILERSHQNLDMIAVGKSLSFSGIFCKKSFICKKSFSQINATINTKWFINWLQNG